MNLDKLNAIEDKLNAIEHEIMINEELICRDDVITLIARKHLSKEENFHSAITRLNRQVKALKPITIKAELAEILDKIFAEIDKKAFTEEIFDEDVFHSTYTESMTREEAECESVIETEIVKLSDVLEILDKYKGGNNEQKT